MVGKRVKPSEKRRGSCYVPKVCNPNGFFMEVYIWKLLTRSVYSINVE